MSDADFSRNVITAVSAEALALRVESHDLSVSWRSVRAVDATRARWDEETWILALVVELHVEGEERVFIAGDVEPIWTSLVETLPVALPGIPDITPIRDALLHADAPVPLYRSGF